MWDVKSWSLESLALIATIVPPAYAGVRYAVRWLYQQFVARSLTSHLGKTLFSFSPPEIARSQATYVLPFCQDVDPGTSPEPMFDPTLPLRPLLDALDEFIADGTSRFLFILGDSGTGKTSAILNYFARRHRGPYRLAVVSLASAVADQHIASISDKAATTLLLDALDEDASIFTARERFRQLLSQSEVFRKLVVTCRSQFFASDADLTRLTAAQNFGPRPAGAPPESSGQHLFITPLSDDQLRRAVRRRIPPWEWRLRRRAYRLVRKAPRLMPRPMLLAYVMHLARRPKPWRYAYQLYDQVVDAWLEREHGTDASRQELRTFLALLAIDIFEHRRERGSESVSTEELKNLIAANAVNAAPASVMVRSLLNRGGDDQWKFAHRSILEHLIVQEFWEARYTSGSRDWTDQMWRFFFERLDACISWLDVVVPSRFVWATALSERHRSMFVGRAISVISRDNSDRFTLRAALYLLAILVAPDAQHIGASLCRRAALGFLDSTNIIATLVRVGHASAIAHQSRAPIEPVYIPDVRGTTIELVTNWLPNTRQFLVLPLPSNDNFVVLEYDDSHLDRASLRQIVPAAFSDDPAIPSV